QPFIVTYYKLHYFIQNFHQFILLMKRQDYKVTANAANTGALSASERSGSALPCYVDSLISLNHSSVLQSEVFWLVLTVTFLPFISSALLKTTIALSLYFLILIFSIWFLSFSIKTTFSFLLTLVKTLNSCHTKLFIKFQI